VNDVDEIWRRKARHFRTLDTKDWNGFRRVFTDDVVVDTTVHQGHTPEVDITSDTTATGIWAMSDIVTWTNGIRLDGHGQCHAVYEKVRGHWKIKSLKQLAFSRPSPILRRRDAGCRRDRWHVGLRACAGRILSRLGHGVALLDLDGERARPEAARLTDTCGSATFGMTMDVVEPASIEAAVTAVDERLGGTDLVISNVGVQLFGAVESFSDREWLWLLDVNVSRATWRRAKRRSRRTCAGPSPAKVISRPWWRATPTWFLRWRRQRTPRPRRSWPANRT
jgi:enoyl-ACP reductase-like protein/SnoaL-like protein